MSPGRPALLQATLTFRFRIHLTVVTSSFPLPVRVVTIIDNGLIKIIDVRRQHRLLPEDRSVPLLAMGNGTVLLSGSAEALPTAGRAANLASPLQRL